MQMVNNTDLVVGDVYLVNMGDKVVADGIMIDGFHLVIDEASLTGEDDTPDVEGCGAHLAPCNIGCGTSAPAGQLVLFEFVCSTLTFLPCPSAAVLVRAPHTPDRYLCILLLASSCFCCYSFTLLMLMLMLLLVVVASCR
jgi:hypothetical protein